MGKGKPTILKVKGETFRALVLKIIASDEKGRPSKLEALHDEQVTHLKGGEEFLVVYALESVLRPKN